MAINKVIYGGNTLIDLTGDTVTASDILAGKKAHDKSGAQITGECTYDSDTTDATAAAGDILSGQTAYVNGNKLTGSMTNNGSVMASIMTVAGEYTIPNGYHDGGGKVHIDPTEQAKLIASNIREDITILGVTGTMSGQEDVHAQDKTVTPGTSAATYTPDSGYNYFSQFTVNAIPYVETANAAGGYTATIADPPSPNPAG